MARGRAQALVVYLANCSPTQTSPVPYDRNSTSLRNDERRANERHRFGSEICEIAEVRRSGDVQVAAEESQGKSPSDAARRLVRPRRAV
jgi:hypothetical protein